MQLQGLSKQLFLFKDIRYNKEDARLIVVQSAPLVVQFAISLASWEFFYILIERNCTVTDLAVSNTMRNVFGLFGCFGWSFAAASNAMVSNVIGAKQNGGSNSFDQAHRTAWCGCGAGLICAYQPGAFFVFVGIWSGSFIYRTRHSGTEDCVGSYGVATGCFYLAQCSGGNRQQP